MLTHLITLLTKTKGKAVKGKVVKGKVVKGTTRGRETGRGYVRVFDGETGFITYKASHLL